MKEQEKIDLINHHLRGGLKLDEKLEFQNMLSNDTAFKSLYLEMKSMQIALKAKVMNEKMNMLKGIEKESKPYPKLVGLIIKHSYRIASIMALILIGLTAIMIKMSYKSSKSTPPPMAEFSQYVAHEHARSGESVEDAQKEKAYNLYVLREFDMAIPMLKSLWENQQDTLSLYYLGVSYHYTSEKTKAQEIFKKEFFNNYNIPK